MNLDDYLEDEERIMGGRNEASNETENSSYGLIGAILGGVEAQLMPEVISECSLISEGQSGVCSSKKSVEIMAKIANVSPEVGPDKVLEKAKEATKCETERCVVTSSAYKAIGGLKLTEEEIRRNFKITGPIDTSLLSNINLDGILAQWAIKFKDFFNYDFNMSDYEKTNGSLNYVNLADEYKNGYRTFGCIINSDVSTGKGVHWMALFVDTRPTSGGICTIEFFNSAGNPPQASFARWLVKAKGQLETIGLKCEIVKVSDIMHQYTQTECGVYALYYIWTRLNGTSYKAFIDEHVDDIMMFEFRQHLFRGPYQSNGAKFDYKEFEDKAKIKWEPDIPKSKIKEIIGRHSGPN
jgi:Ulp1 protease family, C-terminal catalytic domain